MCNNITVLIKSFLRPKCVNNLIKSIRTYYRDIPIVVVDDSEPANNFDYDKNITTYNIPFDMGASYGRNYGVKRIKTPYFLLVDDDFEFTKDTNLELFESIISHSNLDILGGYVYQNSKVIKYYGNFYYNSETKSVECKPEVYNTYENYKTCDLITNFFIAKTESVKQHGWNNDLKIGEHTAFFYDNKPYLKVGYTDAVSLKHSAKMEAVYKPFRSRGIEYFKQWMNSRSINSYTNVKGETVYNKITQLNIDIVTNNLKELDLIFRKYNVTYWLTDGTFLGYFREKSIISHDLDTDIGIMFDSFDPKIIKVLNDHGFKILHYFGYPEDSFEIAISKNGVKTDLFFFYNRNDTVYHCAFMKGNQRIDYVYKPFELEEVNFLGHSFMAPKDGLLYVTTKYGDTWSIPDTNWDWAYSPKNHIKTDIVIDKQLQEHKINNWLKS